VLEFETALLAVDPGIGALPYWDGTHDVLTEAYFGSGPGRGDGYVVNDGPFANFPIETDFNIDNWSADLVDVPGASNGFLGNDGFLRGSDPFNALQTPSLTRFGSSSWTFAYDAQMQCAAQSNCWNDWYSCIEGGSSAGNFHSGAHKAIGGKWRSVAGPLGGDFEDPVTSPNDPIFWVHHANVDRNRLKWMQSHPAEKTAYYGFGRQCYGPKSEKDPGCERSGLDLSDVAGAQFPFSSALLGLNESRPVTHADILCHLGPATASYTYGPSLCDVEVCSPGSRVAWGAVVGVLLFSCACLTASLLIFRSRQRHV
jgi:hypothetical protein